MSILDQQMITPNDTQDAASSISASDLILGRISIMQALSELVKEEKARPGAIVNSLTEEQIGFKEEDKVEFIPFASYKDCIEKEDGKFIKQYRVNKLYELPLREGNIERTYRHVFYGMLTKELDEGMALPVEIPFQGTGIRAAKVFCSFLMKLHMNQKQSWDNTFFLSAVTQTNGKNSWYGPKVSVGRPTTAKEVDSCKVWAKQLEETKEQPVKAAVEQEINTDF